MGHEGNTIFKITLCSWVFKYLVPNLLFIFYLNSSVFLKISKTFFASINFKKLVPNLSLCFLKSSVFLIQKSATRGREAPGAMSILKKWDSRARRVFAKCPMRTQISKIRGFHQNYDAPKQRQERARIARFDVNLKIGDGSKHLQCPLVVQGRSTRPDPKGRVYGWDGMRRDGKSKVSFNFLHALYAYQRTSLVVGTVGA